MLLYQSSKPIIQFIASFNVLKYPGYPSVYFNVLNKDSEYALSLLALGRENEGITPRKNNVANILALFIAFPLSECKTTPLTFNFLQIFLNNLDEFSPLSSSNIPQPTIFLLHTSINKYKKKYLPFISVFKYVISQLH